MKFKFNCKILENLSIESFIAGFFVAVFLFIGFLIPFFIKNSINLQEKEDMQITERGSSHLKIHLKEINRDFLILYVGNGKFRIQEIENRK